MPLAGLTVLDLGQIYQGPYAGFLLAKAGANVIKVEPPGSGESARQRIDVSLGASLPFEMLNANKRSVALNLKTEGGRQLLKDMAARADVLLENFAPGVMDRLGVGWEILREINPRLVYASATGYGLSGPDRNQLAMDLTIQAVSGIMASTGFASGPPVKAGPAIVDFMGGIHLYAAIVTALVERSRTGHGRLVEVSMLESVYPTLASTLGLMYEQGEGAAVRTGNRHSGLSVAPYNVYQAADGHVAIICVQESHWQNLLTAMGREDLRGDPRFETHAARVERLDDTDAIVEAWTSRLTRAQLFEHATHFHIPCAPVREVAEVVSDPHMHERGMLQRVEHPTLGTVVMPNSPLRLHGADALAFQPAPALGADNHAIYGDWLGRSDEALAALARDGVI
jgi:crotonobetainyl-CoA:carnitine CoA-transferase CaiB-like acyl-CoA transferase